MHAFHDPSKEQVSLPHNAPSTFTIRMQHGDVRLRVVDNSNQYRMHEELLVVPMSGLDLAVRLEPTHFVLVRGRVLVQAAGKWVPMPQADEELVGSDHATLSFTTSTELISLDLNGDGAFEERVPRDRLQIMTLCTALGPEPPYLDLTGVTDEVVERDIHLVP